MVARRDDETALEGRVAPSHAVTEATLPPKEYPRWNVDEGRNGDIKLVGQT